MSNDAEGSLPLARNANADRLAEKLRGLNSPAERQCRHCGERFTPHEEVMGYNICPRCFA